MKNVFKLFGVIALAAIIGFSMAACGGGGDDGDGGDNTATYTGTSGGQSYTLKITKDPARYTAQIGDAYELTIGSKKSTGTVSNVSGNVLTLKPSNATTTFTATVSGTSLTSLDDTITWTDNTTAAGPGSLTGSTNPGTGTGGGSGNLAGTTWKYTESSPGMGPGTVTLTFTASTVKMEFLGQTQLTQNGTYTVKGNSITIKWDTGYTGSASLSVDGNTLTTSEGYILIKQ